MPTQSGRFGIAVIGSGEISTKYVPAIQAQPDAEAVWCMDVVESQAKRIGEHHGVPWTTDIDSVLADPAVDAVIACVPHGYHAEVTIRAARAGKHVMCDKPISTNREDALAMIRACREAKVKLGVNLASRCQPCAAVAKDLFERRIIGDIFLTHITCFAHKEDRYWKTGWMEGGNTSWRASKRLGGGGIGIMNMTHDIDRLCYCTGLKVAHIKGESGTFMTDVEVEDTLSAVWRYDNGGIGTVTAGSNMPGGGGEPTRVFGKMGQIELWGPVRVYTLREDTEFEPCKWHEIKVDWIDNDYIPYIADFIRAVREDTPPPITGEDGFRILDVILGIYDSSEKGETVKMRHDID